MSARLIVLAFLVVSAVLAIACEGFDDSELEANAHRATGNEANERGDWDVAVSEYSAAIELDAVADDYTERAYAYFNLGRSADAIADLTAAIALDDELPAAYSQRALHYNELGRWTEAIADLDRAIDLRPDRADQYNGRAFAHLNLGNWAEVVADESRALELAASDDPIIPIYLSNRAVAYAELGQHELALADLDRSIELAPANFTSHQTRLSVLVEIGRIGEARTHVRALNRELGGDPAAVHVLMADVFRAAGLFDEAIEELDAAIELNPTSAVLFMALATTHAERGDDLAACTGFRSALDLAANPAMRGDILAGLEPLERSGACLDEA